MRRAGGGLEEVEAERLGEGSEDRVVLGISRLGREEEVGVEIWGTRRPFTDGSRGDAMVDIVGERRFLNRGGRIGSFT